MSDRAKLFVNGGSQAVRLPKSCRFPDGVTEVIARREGNLVILEDPDGWPQWFVDLIGSVNEEIPRLEQEITSDDDLDPFIRTGWTDEDLAK